MKILEAHSRAEELVRLFFDVIPGYNKKAKLKAAKACAKIFVTEKIRDCSKKVNGVKSPINYLEKVKEAIDDIN